MYKYITNLIDYIYEYHNMYNTFNKKSILDFNYLEKEDIQYINSYNQKHFLINQFNNNYLVGKVEKLVQQNEILKFNIEGLIGRIYNNMNIIIYDIETKNKVNVVIKKIEVNKILYNKISGVKIIKISESINNGIIDSIIFKNSINLNFSNLDLIEKINKVKYYCKIECLVNEKINIHNNYIILDKEMKKYNKNLFIELIHNSINIKK